MGVTPERQLLRPMNNSSPVINHNLCKKRETASLSWVFVNGSVLEFTCSAFAPCLCRAPVMSQ